MKDVKVLVFDMDGTIADLYGVDNWLADLRAENPRPYAIAKSMWDMNELADVLNEIRKAGIIVAVVTWLSMNSSEEFKAETRKAKRDWLAENGFPYDKFYGVQYGTTKADCVRRIVADNQAILFDDNEKIRKGWSLGETIDPAEINIINYLRNFLK